ncbi:MAG: rhodanese-like domain-containing protein [Lachnospiraceae bacterium]|jgi:phage shock protein E|nr:rhodanese-like domain-containing protein [Lachnospiraceae bacterium]
MKKGILLLLVVTISIHGLTGCASDASKNDTGTQATSDSVIEYQKITAEEAVSMMKEEPSHILLDVRTEEEFKEQHIDGAVLIPDSELNDRAETELPDKDALILVYCRSGRRSADAVREMIQMGYTNIYDIGGIIDWPYDTIGR